MDLFFEVLLQLLNPATLLICLAGTILGIVLGAVPGMNGGIGIAVLLPFTYSMNPATGLLLLGGMYLGSSFGGSISGILINVPGTAEAACTTMEGYPMTRSGRAKEALYYSVISSGVGSLVGIVGLIFFTPLLSRFSVRFGPPEMMLLALGGLTIVGSLAGSNVIKGLLSATIGLTIAMVGMHPVTGAMRLTFDLEQLQGGVGLLPAVIGLFAIAEMIEQGAEYKGRAIDPRSVLEATSLRGVVGRLTTKYRTILLKSSVSGTLIGVLPGTGAAIASFLAYGEARASDKDGTFGRGNPAGIVAAESANNAAVGGALVPMLSLGIPGSATSAIMFGALTIHGLIPGQRLFVEHGTIAYTFLIGMLFTAVFLVLVGIAGIPLFARIVRIDLSRIVPVVILISLVGAYSINNSFNDLFVAVGCGIAGVLMARFGMPRTPVVLGLILGRLVEQNLIRSLAIIDARDIGMAEYIFTRPLSVAILILTIYLMYANIRALRKERSIAQSVQSKGIGS
ncbi:MAG: tripartite tricarboxylate transporter permease [Spirochaetales bacterium]|nr:tripartite tricarboxylate transporter permease [Spirochaetales bacterium]